MSNNLYMPFHPGDYHADTAHLRTAAEHGAYMLLLMNYWQAGKPLPTDDRKLAAIARVSPSEWADMRDTMREFFEERDGLLHHKRVDAELYRARAKSQAAREAVNSRKTNPPKIARSTDEQRPINIRLSNQEQEQEQKAANAASSPAVQSFEQQCRDLVGQEPVLVDLNFSVLERLIDEGGITHDDVKSGIIAAMAKPDFRPRHWRQFEGWARGAAKDRLAGRAKVAGKLTIAPLTPEDRSAALSKVGQRYLPGDDPLFPRASESYRAEHGKYPPRDKNGGWYFPESYFALSEAAA
jgi:uncharacterized protein YdaU (DUF1376 family)